MDDDITLYFGSVAETIIALAVIMISGAALTTGYSVLKNHHQRSYLLSNSSIAWNSFESWLLIGVPIILAVHVIKAVVRPSWMTLGVAGAIAIIQIILNCIVRRDSETAYLPITKLSPPPHGGGYSERV